MFARSAVAMALEKAELVAKPVETHLREAAPQLTQGPSGPPTDDIFPDQGLDLGLGFTGAIIPCLVVSPHVVEAEPKIGPQSVGGKGGAVNPAGGTALDIAGPLRALLSVPLKRCPGRFT